MTTPPRRLRRFAAPLLLSLAFATVPLVGGQASPTWVSDVVNLSQSGANADRPQVAFDRHGNAVAVWTRVSSGAGYTIQAATRPAGGAWSQPVNLSDGSRVGLDPQLVVGPEGDAVVVWAHNDRRGSSVIQSAARSADGSWSDARDISADSGFAVEPRLAMDASGQVFAVWNRGGTPQAAVRASGGAWRAPVDLAAGSADSVVVAVGADSSPVVVFRSMATSPSTIVSVTRTEKGWSAPTTLSNGPRDVFTPEVALDADGDGVAVWMEKSTSDGLPSVIRSASRSAAGAWRAAVALSDPGVSAGNPEIALAPDGDAVAAWDVAAGPNIRVIQAASRDGNAGSWSTTSLSDASHYSTAPDVAFGPGGTAIVVWGEALGFTVPTLLKASTRPAGGTWSSPDDVSSPGVQVGSPQVAVDRAGNGLAVWQGMEAGFVGVIQSRGFDGVGPAVTAFRPTRQGVARTQLTYSARAVDAWSGTKKVVWKFGDGQRARGQRVQHTYRQPGSYRVRIVTVDRLGNKTVKRARTRITRR